LGPRGSRRSSMPNSVKIGQSAAKILKFFHISRWRPPPSSIFEIGKLYWLLGSRGWRGISMQNFIKISQSVSKILRFFDFSRWRRSAILICLAHIWTTSSKYLGVSITMQNLVMINAVVFIIWTFQYLARLAGKCLFTPSKLGFLGNFIP